MSHRQRISGGTDESEFVPGHLLVIFKDGTTEKQVQDFLAEKGFTVLNHLKNIETYLLGVPEGQEKALAAELATHPLIEAAELNGVMHTC